MARLALSPYLFGGFILALVFPGCGVREARITETIQQAETLIGQGDLDGGIALLEGCLERQPNRVDALEPLAFAYSDKGDPMLAAITFKRIVELVPQQPEYKLYAARALFDARDVRGAIGNYRGYLAGRPGDRAVWVTLAELQSGDGQTSAAIESYLTAERLEARAAQQVAVGQLYLRSQNLAQAQAWFARALEGDPGQRDEALLGLLEMAVQAKRFTEAEALLQQIDKEFPGRLQASPLASVRAQLAEWRSRREAAKAALDDLAAGSAPAPEVAAPPPPPPPPEEVATEPLPVAEPPPPPPSTLDIARELRAAGDMAGAIREYRQALIEDDSAPDVWAELSEAYLEQGDFTWAKATASEAMRRDPANPRMVLQYLRAAQWTTEREQLLRELEDAYRRFPDHPEIVLVLARAYADEGNLRNARILYGKFIELAPPNHPQLQQVVAELQRIGG